MTTNPSTTIRHSLEPIGDESFILNLGPQHPGTHGVLRIIVKMDGEYVLDADPVLGYGHRMQEKIAENMTYSQMLPYMARMDYLAALSYNQAWVCAVEKLCEYEVPDRAEHIRIITVELNRISSHLLWYGAFLLDLGAFTPFLQAFADREKILDLLESVTGSRLTYCYYRFGGVFQDITDSFLCNVMDYIKYLRERLPSYHDLVSGNVIFQHRTSGIGAITCSDAAEYGVTGPILRGTGISYDVRRNEPYSIYQRFHFEVPTGETGGCQARYTVRMQEIEQSLNIIEQAVTTIPDGPIKSKVPKIIKAPEGEVAMAVETPRGELVVYIVSRGGKTPYRVKFRVPSFSNLSIFQKLARGKLLQDVLGILGSLDLVIPEIDR